jgi:hypothetical protein
MIASYEVGRRRVPVQLPRAKQRFVIEMLGTALQQTAR